MSGKGDKGRAEDFARYKQYDYKSVSGLGLGMQRMELNVAPAAGRSCASRASSASLGRCLIGWDPSLAPSPPPALITPIPCPLQNSNLVISADHRGGSSKDPDGTAQTLWGNMAGRMGDRVERTRPEGDDDKKKKKRDATAPDAEGFALPKKRRVSIRCSTTN
jgi:hypothetical protein